MERYNPRKQHFVSPGSTSGAIATNMLRDVESGSLGQTSVPVKKIQPNPFGIFGGDAGQTGNLMPPIKMRGH